MDPPILPVLLSYFQDLSPLDRTTLALNLTHKECTGTIVAKGDGVVSGVRLLEEIPLFLRKPLHVEIFRKSGEEVSSGEEIGRIKGFAGDILALERTILNTLAWMGGIATETRRWVKSLPQGVRLLDTRKSPPGLLPLAKEAFRDGGGVNHRFTLSDQILIKDNHIALVGSVREAVLRGVAHAPPGCAVICEVRSVEEALEAVSAGAKGILVDNQPPKVWESFYRVVPPEVELEFSGGIRYTHLREIPPPPRPIWISSSYPILSAPPLDLSLEL